MQMEGKRLGGRYEILNRIGGGGMAVVYKAKDISLHRNVAVKVLSESLSNDSEFVRRFSREAQAAASLSHPNIVNVYDVGRDGYIHYIVMELVEGPTLKEYIQEKGPLPVEEAAEIAIQICDGLSMAHDNHIVHRDIKPHNILLGFNGRCKVTDFGIARAASSSTITQTGSVMGSVHYFSPEQARGGVITEKSDIYSLGIVLYEMLTGKLPFDGDSAIGIALKHLQEPVLDPRKLVPGIPDNIVKILMRALEKDPEMRYTSVRAMMQDLRYALQMGQQNEFRWTPSASSTKTSDYYQTVPISTEETQKIPVTPPPVNESGGNTTEKSSYDRFAPRESNRGFKAGNDLADRGRSSSKSGGRVSELTNKRLEELRNIPVGDQTVLQRTVVWLDNVQQKLPWWQKIVFGIITFALIIGLSLWGFTVIIGFLSGDTDKDNVNAGNSNVVVMMDLKGKTEDEAKKTLEDNHLKTEVRYASDGSVPAGAVAKQSVEAGKEIEKGTTVTIFVNPAGVEVPSVIGEIQSRAEDTLRAAGFSAPRNNSRCWDSDVSGTGVAPLHVIAQEPKAGTFAPANSEVKLWILLPGTKCRIAPPGA